HSYLLLLPRPPPSTLFPYTTLFRSPSTVAEPPSPTTTVVAPRSTHSQISSPTPRVVVRRGSSSSGPSSAMPHAVLGPDELDPLRSEEHTSELQSRGHLVCRLLLEKK